MNSFKPSYFNVFTVEEFDVPTPTDMARKAKAWTKVGVAFPHKEGAGYNIQLRSLPLDGKLVVLPVSAEEDVDTAESARRTSPDLQAGRAVRERPYLMA